MQIRNIDKRCKKAQKKWKNKKWKKLKRRTRKVGNVKEPEVLMPCGQWLGYQHLWKIVKRATAGQGEDEVAGFMNGFSTHGFRHERAQELRRKGKHTKDILLTWLRMEEATFNRYTAEE